MIDRISRGAGVANAPGTKQAAASQKQRQSFGQVLQGELQNQVNFSKHAISRAEERGIELTPTLMEKLAGSLEKAQEKALKTYWHLTPHRPSSLTSLTDGSSQP